MDDGLKLKIAKLIIDDVNMNNIDEAFRLVDSIEKDIRRFRRKERIRVAQLKFKKGLYYFVDKKDE